MGRRDLSDEERARLEPHLPTNRGRGGRWQCHRRVISGILFRQRTGLPWRDLPACFGSWKTVHDRHRRWSADGTWERILRAVQTDADAEERIDWSMVGVDSTTCRAHQHAAGASTRVPQLPGRRRSPARHRSDEAMGRSRGGFTNKIHLAGEGGCRPLGFVITPGQWGDAPQMIPALEEIRVSWQAGGRPRTRPDAVLADRAYSSRAIRSHLRRRGIRAVIPPPSDQIGHRLRRGCAGGRAPAFDSEAYKQRNAVDRCINRLKQWRGLAMRTDKLAIAYQAALHLAVIRSWVRR
ncbi:IS5 family transposase [Streptomyces sp. NPDC059618]|uniref:IS5 family transposase n=1 Tax=Streptomyces sp. NPDC059618 TaxID=3346887 RepID=UPI00369D5E11